MTTLSVVYKKKLCSYFSTHRIKFIRMPRYSTVIASLPLWRPPNPNGYFQGGSYLSIDLKKKGGSYLGFSKGNERKDMEYIAL